MMPSYEDRLLHIQPMLWIRIPESVSCVALRRAGIIVGVATHGAGIAQGRSGGGNRFEAVPHVRVSRCSTCCSYSSSRVSSTAWWSDSAASQGLPGRSSVLPRRPYGRRSFGAGCIAARACSRAAWRRCDRNSHAVRSYCMTPCLRLGARGTPLLPDEGALLSRTRAKDWIAGQADNLPPER